MSRNHTPRVTDLLGLVNSLYPPAFAEDWDNVGLQVGDPNADVTKALVCLDPTEQALEQAVAAGADLLISHHPLIFKPLKQVAPQGETGRIVFEAIRQGVAILSAHTNLDRGFNGLNDWLAARLGLQRPTPLKPGDGPDLVKLVVYVPEEDQDKVAEALFKSGAGHIGDYDQCAFRSRGVGSFRPGAGTNPHVGTQGKPERVDEVRLETVVRKDLLGKVVARMEKAHPYEEVAYDLFPMLNRQQNLGMGRIGRLEKSLALDVFAGRVKESLDAGHIRVVGAGDTLVKKVALCTGSGASYLSEAIKQGADVLVTGDVKYHDARRAESEGVALIDAGHFATEQIMVQEMTRVLAEAAAGRQWEIEFKPIQGEFDPFRTI